jgi:ATP-dependent helicase HrpA
LEFGQGHLVERLANHLTKLSGTLIEPEDFDLTQLPGHLRMHVRVLEDTGRALASGQDLRALRVQLAALARAQTQANLYDACGQEWSRKGLVSFDLNELPERIEGQLGDRRVVAYPALHDEGHSVCLALHGHPEAAERATRRGLCRLFFFAAEAALNHHLDYVPEVECLAEHFQTATGGSSVELRAQLALVAADIAYVQGRALVRTPAEFETRLDQGNDALWDALRHAVEVAERIYIPAAHLKAELATAPAVWHDAVQDITVRLHQLAGKTTLTSVPNQDVQEFPRYIRALQVRYRKLGGGGYARDRSNQGKVERWESEVARAEAALAAEGSDTNLLEPFRRLLQEYHVSLFAQEVRTPVPMSAERLERAWNERRVR